MIPSFKLSPKQKQLKQRILNSPNKGKCFLEMYLNEEQKSDAQNVLQLLEQNLIQEITKSIVQINLEVNQQSQKFKNNVYECRRFCQNKVTEFIDHQYKKRKYQNGFMGILFFSLTDLALIYGMWKLISPIFIADESDSSRIFQAINLQSNDYQSILWSILKNVVRFIGDVISASLLSIGIYYFSIFLLMSVNSFSKRKRVKQIGKQLKQRIQRRRRMG